MFQRARFSEYIEIVVVEYENLAKENAALKKLVKEYEEKNVSMLRELAKAQGTVRDLYAKVKTIKKFQDSEAGCAAPVKNTEAPKKLVFLKKFGFKWRVETRKRESGLDVSLCEKFSVSGNCDGFARAGSKTLFTCNNLLMVKDWNTFYIVDIEGGIIEQYKKDHKVASQRKPVFAVEDGVLVTGFEGTNVVRRWDLDSLVCEATLETPFAVRRIGLWDGSMYYLDTGDTLYRGSKLIREKVYDFFFVESSIAIVTDSAILLYDNIKESFGEGQLSIETRDIISMNGDVLCVLNKENLNTFRVADGQLVPLCTGLNICEVLGITNFKDLHDVQVIRCRKSFAVVLAGPEKRLFIYENATANVYIIDAHIDVITYISVSGPDRIVSAGKDGKVCVWDVQCTQ